jgi:hypothetical protein
VEDDHDLIIKINSKLDHVIERLGDIPKIDERIRQVEINNASSNKVLSNNCEEIQKLRTKTEAHNWINSVAILIGTVIGVGIK